MHKTVYEMRIIDWSSDVCSSDLFIHNCSILNLPMTGTYLKQLCAALVSSTPDKRGNWRIFITFELPMLSAVFRAPLSLVHAKTNIERQQRSRSPARILEVDLRIAHRNPCMIDAPQRNGYRQHRDRFPGNGDENGNGVKVPAAPETVSGEPSDNRPLGSKT